MPELLPLEDYVAEVLTSLTPLEPVEVPLASAHGLVLAEDVTAVLPVPPWTNSSMDGYAVRAGETAGASPEHPVLLPVAGDVPAGVAPEPLAPGTAQRIMTGAMLPEGADAVVKVEDTDQEPGHRPLPEQVGIMAEVGVGIAARHAGEDVAVGDRVMAAGTVLSATAVSSLASVGRGTVRVLPRVRVAVVSTGAELVDPGEALPTGAIPDSNSLLIAGLVEENGETVASVSRSGDTAEALASVLARAADGADLIITSGGVSAGAFDPLKMLADASREGTEAGAGVALTFSKVAMQPGKPQGHGTVRASDGREVPIIMLPGNPVSVLVSFTTIVAPALARLDGHDGVALAPATTSDGVDQSAATALTPARAGTALPVRTRAGISWRTAGSRRQHVPVRLIERPADLPEGTDAAPQDVWVTRWVAPTHRLGSGSHLVASLPAAQALAVVPANTPAVEPGDEVGLIALASPAAPGGAQLPVRSGAPVPPHAPEQPTA